MASPAGPELTPHAGVIEVAQGVNVEDRVLSGREGAVAASLVRRNGPTLGRILFVNGAQTTATAQRWAIRGLTDFELVLFDFPGVGGSRTINAKACATTPEADAAVVLRLVQAYQPDMLISLSWGGSAALLALAERPASVRSAIIASYSFGLSARMCAMCDELLALVDVGDRERAADLPARGLGERLPPRLQNHFRDHFLTLDPDQERAIVDHIRQTRSLRSEDYAVRMASIDIPVLFANGSEDRYTPPESVRPFASRIRQAQFATLPRCGHFLANESRTAAETVCREIRRWWAGEDLSEELSSPSA